MKNSLETKLGIFVVLAIFAAIFIIEMVGGAGIFQRGYHVSAQFDTVQELKVGDSVKMAGVEIGRVEKITLADGKVAVTMKLHPDAGVKTDSQAVIKFAGLMGQNFVAISFGSPDAPKSRGWRDAGNGGTARFERHHDQARQGRRWIANLATAFPATASTI